MAVWLCGMRHQLRVLGKTAGLSERSEAFSTQHYSLHCPPSLLILPTPPYHISLSCITPNHFFPLFSCTVYKNKTNTQKKKKKKRYSIRHKKTIPHHGGQPNQKIWQGQQLTDLRKHGLLLTFYLEILASFVDPRQAFGPDKIIPPQILANAKVHPNSQDTPCAGANRTIRVSPLLPF